MLKYILSALIFVGMGSCIKNDLPYPYVELAITNVEGEGFTLDRIDSETSTAYLSLEETTDIESVTITSVTYTEGANLSREVEGTFSLSTPLNLTLYLYQSYDWQIVGEQSISRSFSVKGQIGAERIDPDLLTVEVDVNESTVDLSAVDILSMKLGAEEITTYSPTLESLEGRDFSSVVRVVATAHDRSETWSIRLYPVEATVSLSADAWGCVAWLRGVGDTADESLCYFEYREVGSDTWIKVESDSVSNGEFETALGGLTPESEYEFVAYAGGVNSDAQTCTTGSIEPLPNGDFEEWQTISKTIYPYLSEEYWASGNVGSTLVGTTNVTMGDDSDIAPGSEGVYSAKLESASILGFFAAGNIFTGQYVKSVVISGDGVIAFGRPFTSRPLRLEGYAKYESGEVNFVSTKFGDSKLEKGDQDQGMLYIALGTWSAEDYGYDSTGVLEGTATSPIVIDTRSEASFFNSSTDDVVAYGQRVFSYDDDEAGEWHHFSIELDYRDLVGSDGETISAYSRVPTHIVVVGSASRYGDYFTGSSSSRLWLDDLELVYDLE